MIAAHGVRLTAGNRTLIDDATFEARDGEFVAVLGANGAGKTTLLRTLAGVRKPQAGRVLLGQRDLCDVSPSLRAQRIAHLTSDDLFIERLLVRDVVAMGRYPHHRWWQWNEEPADGPIVQAALRAVEMQRFAGRRFDTLSSGERQRVWLALALAQEAPLLLLDEPTSHLDVRAARDVLTLLRAQVHAGKTVICALHDLNEAAAFADRILLIGNGEVLAFAPPAQALDPRLLERAYGLHMETFQLASGKLRVF